MSQIVAGRGSQIRSFFYALKHENYNTAIKPTFENDIALITLSEALDLSDPNVQPIEMFTNFDEEVTPGSYCLSIGCSSSRPSTSLYYASQVVDSEVMDLGSCKNEFPSEISSSNICARKPCDDIDGKIPCRGDSGSPLVCPDQRGRLKVAGLVSFGSSRCTSSSTTVFTRIQNFYDWVLNQS